MIRYENIYLTQKDWQPKIIEGIGVEEMLDLGITYSPEFMLYELTKAKEYLINTPGPNQEARKVYAPEWLDPWLVLYRKKLANAGNEETGLIPTNKLIPFPELANTILLKNLETFKAGYIPRQTGLLLLGSGEGTPAHTFAIDYIDMDTIPILAFERDSYTQKHKERKERFLPLEMLITMMADYPNTGLVTVLPERSNESCEISDNDYYQALFNKTTIDYCYATAGEPYANEKRRRGQIANFTMIPRHFSASTSERVKRAFRPEILLQGMVERGFYNFLYDDCEKVEL